MSSVREDIISLLPKKKYVKGKEMLHELKQKVLDIHNEAIDDTADLLEGKVATKEDVGVVLWGRESEVFEMAEALTKEFVILRKTNR